MNAVRYTVDAVIDRTGRRGRDIWLKDGLVSLEPPIETGPMETIHRTGFIVPGLRDAHLHLASITAATSGVTLEGTRDLDDISRRITGRGDQKRSRTSPARRPRPATAPQICASSCWVSRTSGGAMPFR